MKINVNITNIKVISMISNSIGDSPFSAIELRDGVRNLKIDSISLSLSGISLHLSWDARDVDFWWDEEKDDLEIEYSDWYAMELDETLFSFPSCACLLPKTR